MKALTLTTADCAATVNELPVPEPMNTQLLVKVHAVALNPVDVQFVTRPIAGQDRRIVGSDFAGEVVSTPNELKDPKDPRIKVGARVAGYMVGEYVTPEHDLVWLIPKSLSYEEAAAISMCSMTAAQGVFYRLQLPCPWGETHTLHSTDAVIVFIYGASTSLGMYAAQMVHLAAQTAGRKIRLIGAASVRNHAMLNATPYAYDGLVDYHEATWADKVRELTDGRGVDFGVDCISEGKTVAGVCSVLKDDGKYAVFRAPTGAFYNVEDLRIKPLYGAVWEGLGLEVHRGDIIVPKSPKAREFAARFFQYLTDGALVNKVLIEPNPIRQMPGEFERIPGDGFSLLGGGDLSTSRDEEYMKPISAEKLVYSVV